MLRQIVFSAVVALFTVHAARSASLKYHQVVAPHGGPTVAEFTSIENFAAKRFPYVERDLYKDDGGRLLVIRRNYPTSTNFNTTYFCVATGETLEIDQVRQQSVTLVVGGRSLSIRGSGVDRNGTSLPASIAGQARDLGQSLSAPCRDALHRLAEIGTYDAIELNADATELRVFLFPDIPDLDPVDPDLLFPRLNLVNPFDPSETPPDPFERQFGQAYYE